MVEASPKQRQRLPPEEVRRRSIAACKAWREANPDKQKTSTRKWYDANKAAKRAWKEANPEKVRAAYNRWYDKNGKASMLERNRAWRAANPEKAKAAVARWVAKHPEEMRALKLVRRARKAANGGICTAADIRRLRELQRNKCVWCLKPFGKATPDVDHYVPLSLGGTSDPSNLRLLHARCNRSKKAKDPLQHGLQHGLLCW